MDGRDRAARTRLPRPKVKWTKTILPTITNRGSNLPLISRDWQVDRALGAEDTQASGKGPAPAANLLSAPAMLRVRRTHARACNLPTL